MEDDWGVPPFWESIIQYQSHSHLWWWTDLRDGFSGWKPAGFPWIFQWNSKGFPAVSHFNFSWIQFIDGWEMRIPWIMACHYPLYEQAGFKLPYFRTNHRYLNCPNSIGVSLENERVANYYPEVCWKGRAPNLCLQLLNPFYKTCAKYPPWIQASQFNQPAINGLQVAFVTWLNFLSFCWEFYLRHEATCEFFAGTRAIPPVRVVPYDLQSCAGKSWHRNTDVVRKSNILGFP